MSIDRVAVLMVGAVLLMTSAAGAQPVTIALSGTPAPGANGGVFQASTSTFSNPVLNNAGTVVFGSNITGSATFGQVGGLFASTNGTITPIALRGNLAPPGSIPSFPSATYGGFDARHQSNDVGQTAFQNSVNAGVPTGALFQDGPNGVTPLAVIGQAAPGTVGATFGSGTIPAGFTSYDHNAAGQVAFFAGLTNVANPNQDRGVFLSTGGTTPTTTAVALRGDAAPGTSGATFDNMLGDRVQIGASGRVTFASSLTAGSNAAQTSGLFTWLGGTTTAIAVRGGAAPGTDGATYFSIHNNTSVWRPPVMNEAGRTVFVAGLTPGGSLAQTAGLFAHDGGVTTAIAIRGDSAPGTASSTFNNFELYVQNASGRVAFVAGLTGTSIQSQGLFIHSAGTNTAVAIRGGAAPGTAAGVTYNNFAAPAINWLGEVAWLSELAGAGVTNANRWAVFSTAGGTPQQVVRWGDQIDVDPTAGVDLRTVSAIRFGSTDFSNPSTVFNDFGTLVMRLEFTNNTSGVFTFTPVPEPTSVSCVGVGVLGVVAAWQRRRRARTGA